MGLATGPSEFTTASNPAGETYLTKYPNQIVKTSTFDTAGTETALSYVDSAGADLVGFTNTVDVDSKVRYSSSIASDQTYTYDDRARLTKVEDTTAAGCITRQYKFSLDSNREELKTSTPATDGACSTASTTTAASSFDTADRITGGTYGYDELGRTRTVPKADTDQAGQSQASDLQISYYGNDMVAELSQAVPSDDNTATVATTKTFTLDPAQRLSETEDTTAGAALRQTANRYADTGDAPAWITDKTRPSATAAWVETWTRNVLGPDGDLALIQPSTGPAKVQISNLHGDIVTELDNTTGAPVFDTYVETTEYGLPKTPDTSLGQNYGWLGAKGRSTDSIGGLTLMGVRLYNPATGRFSSMDPIYGGNDNTYTYPTDPVGNTDLSGTRQDPGPARPKCSCTKINKLWLPYIDGPIKWTKWKTVPAGKHSPFTGWARRQIFNAVSGITRITRVTLKIHYGTRSVVQRRCKDNYWEYRVRKQHLTNQKASFGLTLSCSTKTYGLWATSTTLDGRKMALRKVLVAVWIGTLAVAVLIPVRASLAQYGASPINCPKFWEPSATDSYGPIVASSCDSAEMSRLVGILSLLVVLTTLIFLGSRRKPYGTITDYKPTGRVFVGILFACLSLLVGAALLGPILCFILFKNNPEARVRVARAFDAHLLLLVLGAAAVWIYLQIVPSADALSLSNAEVLLLGLMVVAVDGVLLFFAYDQVRGVPVLARWTPLVLRPTESVATRAPNEHSLGGAADRDL